MSLDTLFAMTFAAAGAVVALYYSVQIVKLIHMDRTDYRMPHVVLHVSGAAQIFTILLVSGAAFYLRSHGLPTAALTALITALGWSLLVNAVYVLAYRQAQHMYWDRTTQYHAAVAAQATAPGSDDNNLQADTLKPRFDPNGTDDSEGDYGKSPQASKRVFQHTPRYTKPATKH